MSKNFKANGWVKAAFAGAIGLGALINTSAPEKHDPVKIIDPRFDNNTGHMKDEVLSPFSVIAYPRLDQPEPRVATLKIGAKPHLRPPLSEQEESLRIANYFLQKYTAEKASPLKKFLYIEAAYKSLPGKMNDAGSLNMRADELASLLSTAAIGAIQALQAENPQTSFEKAMNAKNILVAAQYAGMQANGENDETIAGNYVDRQALDRYKNSLIGPAAIEVISQMDMPQIQGISDDDILLGYWDKLDLLSYAVKMDDSVHAHLRSALSDGEQVVERLFKLRLTLDEIDDRRQSLVRIAAGLPLTHLSGPNVPKP